MTGNIYWIEELESQCDNRARWKLEINMRFLKKLPSQEQLILWDQILQIEMAIGKFYSVLLVRLGKLPAEIIKHNSLDYIPTW